MATTKRWLAFSDTHFPNADPAAIEWVVKQIRAYKPDIVLCLGDLFEGEPASKWNNESDHDIDAELTAVDEFLREVRSAAPKASRRLLIGNHDDHYLAPDASRINRKVRPRCDWRTKQYDRAGKWLNEELCRYWTVACEYVNCQDKGVNRIGQVAFAHGYACGVNSDEMQALGLGRTQYGLFVSGHTHRPKDVTQCCKTKTVLLDHWYANTGCLSTLKPEYARKLNTSQWGHACVIGEAELLKSPRVGQRWDAHLEVRRTSEDWNPGRTA